MDDDIRISSETCSLDMILFSHGRSECSVEDKSLFQPLDREVSEGGVRVFNAPHGPLLSTQEPLLHVFITRESRCHWFVVMAVLFLSPSDAAWWEVLKWVEDEPFSMSCFVFLPQHISLISLGCVLSINKPFYSDKNCVIIYFKERPRPYLLYCFPQTLSVSILADSWKRGWFI